LTLFTNYTNNPTNKSIIAHRFIKPKLINIYGLIFTNFKSHFGLRYKHCNQRLMSLNSLMGEHVKFPFPQFIALGKRSNPQPFANTWAVDCVTHHIYQ